MPKTRAEFCNHFVVARLIHEVKIRPCLWNPTEKHYNDRQHMAAAWEEISNILDISEDLLRMKWKTLRDFFKRIVRQCGVRDVDDYIGGWRYFKMLWFINQPDLLQNDGDSSDEATNTSNDEDTNTNSDEATNTINELVKYEPEEFSETEVLTEEPVPIPNKTRATNSDDDHNQMFLKKGARNLDDDHNQMLLKKGARNLDDDHNQMFLKKGARNLDDDHNQMLLKKRARNSDDDDYDQMFLRSLTPYFKQLEPFRKLVVRNKIQDILLKELLTQK